MLDPKKLLDDLLGSKSSGAGSNWRDKAGQATQLAKDNPLATGAIAAALLGTGAGRKLTGSAVKIGGLALVGGLAYKAYQNYQSGKQVKDASADRDVLPPPDNTEFDARTAPQGEGEFALTLVRAMVAAANADGHVDEAEREKIAGKLKESGMDADAESFVVAELQRPGDMNELVASAQTEAQRVELYTASRLAIEPDTRAERGYLDMLAGRLGLPDALVEHVEATVAAAREPAA